MNAEHSAMGNIDRNREKHYELSPLMHKAHEKAVRDVFMDPDASIQEAEFDSVYGKEAVTKDVALADYLEKKFSAENSVQMKNAHKIAEVFEAIVITQSEMSNWLGPNAHTLKTSRFDDFVNKVDMLAEWTSVSEGKSILALAVDVTFSAGAIAKKMAAIKAEIDSGQLGSVRYFKDIDGSFLGTRRNVPRAVIGVSEAMVGELASLWVNGEKKELGVHAVQKLLVNQMSQQLAYMRSYAERTGRDHIVQAYDQALATMKRLRDNQMSITLTDALRQDPVSLEISEQTKAHFPKPPPPAV